MKILFLTTVLPRQKQMGSEVASQCFIDGLQAVGHDVTVMGYLRTDNVFSLNSSEIAIGRRYIETKKAKFHFFIWLLLSFLKRLPYSSAKYYSQDYVKGVQKVLAVTHYDRVIIDHPQLAWLEPLIIDKRCLIVLSHNIEHELYFDAAKQSKRRLERWIYNREAHLVQKLENRLATIAQQVWTLTRHDAAYFSEQPNSGKILAFDLPPGLSTPPASSLVKTFDIGLIGSWAWKPNFEGLQWFLEQVYPQLSESLSIHVAGRGAERLMEKYPKIKYCGFVPDAQEFMAQARVVAIPTLTGGGVQIKTLDAIASGSSVVATAIALRGISNPPSTVQIINDPHHFAQCLIATSATNKMSINANHAATWFEHRKQNFLLDIEQTLLPDAATVTISSSFVVH
jgi:polysaccharide biosynthesis protein PslH